MLPVIGPFRLIDIVRVFRKARRIQLSEIGISGMVWGRLPNIIKSCPEELSAGKRVVPLSNHTCLGRFCPPAGRGIAKCRTLLIHIRQYGLAVRETIDFPALYRGSSLTSINDPVRMLLVVFVIIFLRIIITGHFYQIRTLLGVLPRHVVGTNGDFRIFTGIVDPYFTHQIFRNFLSPFADVGIINLISDAPQDQAWMVPVPAHPARHIFRIPFWKEAPVIIWIFGTFPHVKRLRHYEKSHGIRQFHHVWSKHIVGKSEGIHAHGFQFFQLPLHRPVIVCRAEAAKVMVFTYTVELYFAAVQQKSLIRTEFFCTETDRITFRLYTFPLQIKLRFQIIQMRMFHRPALYLWNRHCIGDCLNTFLPPGLYHKLSGSLFIQRHCLPALTFRQCIPDLTFLAENSLGADLHLPASVSSRSYRDVTSIRNQMGLFHHFQPDITIDAGT